MQKSYGMHPARLMCYLSGYELVPSFPLGIMRCVLQEKKSLKPKQTWSRLRQSINTYKITTWPISSHLDLMLSQKPILIYGNERVLLKAGPQPSGPQPAAQGTLHGPWPSGPLHSSHPAVQFRTFVSGTLQRMFWSVFQNGRRWVLVSL